MDILIEFIRNQFVYLVVAQQSLAHTFNAEAFSVAATDRVQRFIDSRS